MVLVCVSTTCFHVATTTMVAGFCAVQCPLHANQRFSDVRNRRKMHCMLVVYLGSLSKLNFRRFLEIFFLHMTKSCQLFGSITSQLIKRHAKDSSLVSQKLWPDMTPTAFQWRCIYFRCRGGSLPLKKEVF